MAEQSSTRQHTATAIPFIYSFSGNCAASAPIITFICLWAIYIFPGSVYIFPPEEKADPSWEYIIRSQVHECGNWDWDPDIPFLGIFVSKFRYFVFAVQRGKYQHFSTLSPRPTKSLIRNLAQDYHNCILLVGPIVGHNQSIKHGIFLPCIVLFPILGEK